MSSACFLEWGEVINKPDLEDFEKTAREISISAGKIIINGFRSWSTTISFKGPKNIVTNVDRDSEKYIVENLHKKYPDHTIIAEEGSSKKKENDYTWYIDPLDGTNNFAHGLPMFCISMGLFSRSQNSIIVGVVYDAYHQELFSAIKGRGAFLNDNPISISATDVISHAMVSTGFPYDRAVSDNNNLKEFIAFFKQVQGIRRMGSAALDLCYVASGRFDGYWELKLYPWDMAAGSLIVEEAGGTVTKFDGSEFDPLYPEIVASNGKIHRQMLEVLSRR